MPTQEVHPRLRKDLRFSEEDGAAVLIDRLVGAVHKLAPAELRAARALDGKTRLTEVAARAAMKPGRLKDFLGWLEAEHLLETEKTRAALDEHRALLDQRAFETPDRMVPLRKLPLADDGVRWDCHACGMCCRGLLVPLRDDEIRRVDTSLYQDILRGGSFHVPWAPGGDEPVQRILRQVGSDQHCIFLAKDGRCQIHARQGAASKPDTCQLFPIATVGTALGPRLTLRIACGSLHKSAHDGTPLGEYAAWAFDLEKIEKVRGLYDAPLAGKKVPFERYAELERTLRTLLDEESGATPRFIERALRVIPGATPKRHATDRVAVGQAILARLRADDAAPSSVIGWFGDKVAHSLAMRRALQSLARGKVAPSVSRASAEFIGRTFKQVLWAGEPYKMPDLAVALRALLIVTELILHTVGPKGGPSTAVRATRVWWMASFEDGELTPVLWEAMRNRRG